MLVASLLAGFVSAEATVYQITSAAEFASAASSAQPGDTIEFPAGSVSNWGTLTIASSGASGNPITITGPATYATTITGTTSIKVTGAFVAITGLKFINSTGSYPIHFSGGRDSSVSQCYFSGAAASSCVRSDAVGSDPASASRLLITNNYFTNTTTNGVTLTGPADLAWIGGNIITSNVFRDAPSGSTDGESIVLYSDGLHLGYNLNSTIRNNVFDNWDKDIDDEVFSIKSGNNLIEGNVFAYCDGYVSLRRENGNWVEGNYLYKCQEGFRIYGENHVIINNVVEDCAKWAVNMGQGWDTASIAKPARNCVVANNTFWNVAYRAFYFPTTGTPSADPNPKNNLLANNIVDSSNSTGELVRDQLGFYNAGNNNTATNNVYYTQNGNYGPLGSNYIQASSQLTKSGNAVYLTSASPAVDFATNVTQVTADFFLQDRRVISTRDAGHHEYELGSTPGLPATLPPVPEDRAYNATQPRLAKLALYPDGSNLAMGEVLNIDAAYSNGVNDTFGFDFGDGTSYTGSESFITHAYTSPGNYNITLTVSGPGGSDFVVVPVTVAGGGGGNTAPVANGDSYSTNQDVVLNVAAPGVLGNDTDAESNPLTVNLASVTAALNGSVNIGTDGSFTYTPNTGYYGTDSFTYQATDGTDNSTSATVSLTVNAVSQWTQILYDDFEGGYGNWVDGGSDSSLYSGGTFAHQGGKAIDLQDNTNTSVMSTNNLSLSGYTQIRVEFWFYTVSMDNSNEDFWLQISTNGGNSYTTVATWALNADFQNNQFYSDTVVISGYTLNNQTRIRFRCDASDDNDDVYIDEVRVSAK